MNNKRRGGGNSAVLVPLASPFDWAGWRKEFWTVASVLLLDAAIGLIAIAVLLLMFFGARLMEAAGYPPGQLDVFNSIHFYAYVLVSTILGIDLVLKVASILIGVRRNK